MRTEQFDLRVRFRDQEEYENHLFEHTYYGESLEE